MCIFICIHILYYIYDPLFKNKYKKYDSVGIMVLIYCVLVVLIVKANHNSTRGMNRAI